MLDVLKGFNGTTIEAPTKPLWRPDPDRLASGSSASRAPRSKPGPE
jgi:hypothetical protein